MFVLEDLRRFSVVNSKLCYLFAWFEYATGKESVIGLFLYKFCFYVFQVLVLGKVSSSMMGTFGALLEIILILYPFHNKVKTERDFLPVYRLKYKFD